jgi:tetratricopeptide (TPR) repeat protein
MDARFEEEREMTPRGSEGHSGPTPPGVSTSTSSVPSMTPRSWRRRIGRSLVVLLLLSVIGVGSWMIGAELWAGYQVRATHAALARQDYEGAWDHVRAALRGRPRSADLHLLAARVARQNDRITDANYYLQKCYELQGGISEPLKLERMMLDAQTGRVEAVVESLYAYVRQDHPAAPQVLEALCLGFRRARLAGPAVRCAEMWLEREPDNVQALLCHGACCGEMGNFSVATKDFERAVELAPHREGCRQNLALARLETCQFQSAAELFAQVLANEPDNRVAQIGLAQCKIALNEHEQARAILDALLEEESDHPEALVERGKVALQMGRADQAEYWTRRALASDPNNYAAAFQLELSLNMAGKRAEAEEASQKRKQLEAEMQRLQTLMAVQLAKPGPHPPPLYHELGAIFLRRGDQNQALHWFFKGLERDPRYVPTHRVLAEFFARAGDEERAAQHRAMLPPRERPASEESASVPDR